MEFFIRNLGRNTTKDQVQDVLAATFQKFQIQGFDVNKTSGKPFARLTIADLPKAQKFFDHITANPILSHTPSGTTAHITMSKNAANRQLIRVLQKEEKDRGTRKERQAFAKPSEDAHLEGEYQKSLELQAIECGRWESTNNMNQFTSYHILHGNGWLARDGRTLVATINTSASKRHDVIIDFLNIISISTSSLCGKQTLTISLTLAPKIFEHERPDAIDPLNQQLQALFGSITKHTTVTRFREPGLPSSPSLVAGTCLTFRLSFRHNVLNLEKRVRMWTANQFSIGRTPEIAAVVPAKTLVDQVSELNAVVKQRNFPFHCRFQIHALWANASLSPREVQHMLPSVESMRARLGEVSTAKILQRLVLQLVPMDASTGSYNSGSEGAIEAMKQQEGFLLHTEEQAERTRTRDEVSIHRATVTPTGIYLYGPENIAANRILRQYRAHQDCFLRVLFADENEERVEFDRNFSNERVFRGRFLSMLRNGIDLAGEHFDFLVSDALPNVPHVSVKRFPRLRGLSELMPVLFRLYVTSKLDSISLPMAAVPYLSKRGNYYISPRRTTSRRHTRYATKVGNGLEDINSILTVAGAKGMLTLDSRLLGYQIRLRDSMVKFTGSPSNEIEICGMNARPLPFKLNRQIIKILEDLDISPEVMEELQERAVQRLRGSAKSAISAIEFVSHHLSNSSSGLPKLLRCLKDIGLQLNEDDFFREILGALLQIQLREIKYRSRIPVPSAVTLYGISDETGWLGEGQIFVTFVSGDSEGHLYLNGKVAVTRSPALHPGDVQVVQAVAPPENSCLWELRNCVVFSQKGTRDLPSMLSGGDLDGDLYNVIYDENLIPKKTDLPAAYTPPSPVDIGRPVTSNDMTEFFIDFMQNDQLGRIANAHQVFADESSARSPECLLLAELHSTAVDFSKSGIPVDVQRIPKTSPYRPDFMAPSPSTKVEKGIDRPATRSSAALSGTQRYRYFTSDRVLGRLYRALDEDAFFRELEEDTTSIFSLGAPNTLFEEILEWVEKRIRPDRFEVYLELATKVRDYYESNMLEIMALYATNRTTQLTEKEVFIGNIMGMSGSGSRYQREQSDYMKSRFDRDLRDIKQWMEEQTEAEADGFLCLAAACLRLFVKQTSNVGVRLASFGWFAAGLCVPQLFSESE
ncbi:MAG: hypothetical protein Q9160_004252 [Pyrenula sp. 1 TL-2023]